MGVLVASDSHRRSHACGLMQICVRTSMSGQRLSSDCQKAQFKPAKAARARPEKTNKLNAKRLVSGGFPVGYSELLR